MIKGGQRRSIINLSLFEGLKKGFMAVDVPKGKGQVVLHFVPHGLKEGTIAFLLELFPSLATMLFEINLNPQKISKFAS